MKRRDKPSDKQLTTDVWFASSRDGGRTFAEAHVAGPFDAAAASSTSSTSVQGRFIGDYQGFAAYPRGFGAVFAQSKKGVTKGPSDVYFARIQLGAGGGTPRGGGGSLRLSVRPRVVHASEKSRRFTFTVGRSSGGRVKGALVRFVGAHGRTDARGRVRLRAELSGAGRYTARATKSGIGSASVTVRVLRTRPRGDTHDASAAHGKP